MSNVDIMSGPIVLNVQLNQMPDIQGDKKIIQFC